MNSLDIHQAFHPLSTVYRPDLSGFDDDGDDDDNDNDVDDDYGDASLNIVFKPGKVLNLVLEKILRGRRRQGGRG